MLFDVKDEGNVSVMKIITENLDMTSYQQLTDEFQGLITDGRVAIVDMSAINYVDSAGFGSLMIWRRHARSKGGDLMLCCMSSGVQRTFKNMRLDLLFPSYADVESAQKAARESASKS